MDLYAIYENKEDLVYVGNAIECCRFLKCTKYAFFKRYQDFKRGVRKKPKIEIYKVEVR
ncbi:MAG: hypothetical protein ACRCX2_32370 [Paraclostridium sp.]